MIKPLPNCIQKALTAVFAVLAGLCSTVIRVDAGEDAVPPVPLIAEPKTDKATTAELMSGLDWSATKQSFLD